MSDTTAASRCAWVRGRSRRYAVGDSSRHPSDPRCRRFCSSSAGRPSGIRSSACSTSPSGRTSSAGALSDPAP
uniref:hypothetical protein n=1 Tax=Ornithinimicrobium sp. CNJ-824 TaxID=1904966 RepID=UPI00117EA008|nr:hypothetical protein [Ornithinimicrobium sp. CNJ-824]